jgi:hypothetical protein
MKIPSEERWEIPKSIENYAIENDRGYYTESIDPLNKAQRTALNTCYPSRLLFC